jgi:putative heme-binding domain-containing protein
MASDDSSGLVRLVLASNLQRLPVNRRIPLARALLSHTEDAHDPNLPSLIWTALIPVASTDPASLATLAADCRIPEVVGLIARRLGEDIESRPDALDRLLGVAASRPLAFQSQVVSGLAAALAGWRKARKPPGWDTFQVKIAAASDAALRSRIRELEVLFGDGRALEEVRRLALDDTAEIEERRTALRTLIESRPPDLRSICEKLLRVRFVNAVAVRGLALFDDPAIGQSLARNYRAFHPSERPAALETLVSRTSFALALLDQVAAGKIARNDITPFHARQILSLNDAGLTKRLGEVWGEVRSSTADRRDRIAALKQLLDPATLARADLRQGRALFNRVCAGCHRLHGEGGAIGPDLTGSGRDNLDYLLENIIDPAATVTADFRMVVIAMNDGRVLNGLIKAQTPRTLTLQTQTEALALDRAEIEAIKPSTSSLMPDGLLDNLKRDEVRDLIGYLGHPAQVSLPVGGGG